MDLKEIGIKLVWMIIKWLLEDPTRIQLLAFFISSLLIYAMAYPFVYIIDKLEAKEEQEKRNSK